MKLNFMRFCDGRLMWRQIEKRGDKVFMRFKQRNRIIITAVPV